MLPNFGPGDYRICFASILSANYSSTEHLIASVFGLWVVVMVAIMYVVVKDWLMTRLLECSCSKIKKRDYRNAPDTEETLLNFCCENASLAR